VQRLPRPVLERLPRYLRILEQELLNHNDYTSSLYLGSEIGVEEFQVRKDLAFVDIQGIPGKGYPVRELSGALKNLLGLNVSTTAVVIGAGRLGQALTQYPGFSSFGLKIVGLLDIDENKVGEKVGDLEILSAVNSSSLIRKMQVDMAIITVPAQEAQHVADEVIAGQVRAIWNFAPVVLEVPPTVFVRNEDLTIGLAFLCHFLASTPARTKKL
jgi:redox-sensing transcriptional repressor